MFHAKIRKAWWINCCSQMQLHISTHSPTQWAWPLYTECIELHEQVGGEMQLYCPITSPDQTGLPNFVYIYIEHWKTWEGLCYKVKILPLSLQGTVVEICFRIRQFVFLWVLYATTVHTNVLCLYDWLPCLPQTATFSTALMNSVMFSRQKYILYSRLP